MEKVQSMNFEIIDKKQKLSFAGIVVSAFLAISCCVGPAVFLFTGASISFLGSLSILEPFKPYFVASGAIFLGIAFWTTFIKKKKCACPADRTKVRLAQIITVAGLLLFITSLFFTQIVTLIIGG
ncbi:MAG: hypothetical protein KAH95_13305 [Spirochaetales bacterium]|nr:hypothetical protein [Spirochaetales bacterium]